MTSPSRWQGRTLPLVLLALLAAIPVLRVVQNGGALLSALAIPLSLMLVGIVPGLLISLIVGAATTASLLEAVAIGFGVSFAGVQLLTWAALQFHIGAAVMVSVLWLACVTVTLLFVVWPPKSRMALSSQAGGWLVLVLAAVLSISLYIQTPFEPWMTGEDAIHVAVINRLAYEPRPSLTNIYWAQNFPYTYPYPATHYFVALVSRASRLEPLFVYQKARMLWGPIAILTLFAAARIVFRSDRVALASAVAAATLTLTGAFGPISSTWGQLAPVSHASDVAMTAVLPALLLLLMHFVSAERRATAAVFFVGTASLALTLSVVHIREVVQFLVYTVSAWAAYRFLLNDRPTARRFGIAAVTALGLTVLYLKWYKTAVGHVDYVVGQRRAKLIADVSQMSGSEFFTPIWLNGYFTVNHEYFYYFWFPVILLLAPWALYRYRANRLVPFITVSLLSYALIVFVPFIAIIYTYLTYYEILFTPVRNSLFFIYLLAGPLLLMAADALTRAREQVRRAAMWLAVAGGLWLAFDLFGRFFKRSQNMSIQNAFFLVLIASLAVVLLRSRRRDPAPETMAPAGSRMTGFYALLAIVALISFSWKNSPLKFDSESARWTTLAYLNAMPDIRNDAFSSFRDPISDREISLGEKVRLMAPPSPALLEAGKSMPSNVVMLHNMFNTYASPVFMPQHIVMWPLDSAAGLEFNARLFPVAWGALVETAERYQQQPFYNTVETLDERLAYMQKVGATHALIDPMYYDRLRPLFESWQPQLKVIFDDGSRWAIVALRSVM